MNKKKLKLISIIKLSLLINNLNLLDIKFFNYLDLVK